MTVSTPKPKASTKPVIEPTKKPAPHLRIPVPTHIAQAASKEPGRFAIDQVAIARDPIHATRTLLAACDGRILGIVETDIDEEGDPTSVGLVPQFIPPQLCSKTASTLRLANGTGVNLFGPELCWRDDLARIDAPQIQGGAWPDISHALPKVEVRDGSWVCVTFSAKALARLARAVNDPDDKDTDVLTLFIAPPEKPEKSVQRTIAVVGRRGIGVISSLQFHGESSPLAMQQKFNDISGRWQRASKAAGFIGTKPEMGDAGSIIDEVGPLAAEEMGGAWDPDTRTLTVNTEEAKKPGKKNSKGEAKDDL